MATTKPPPIRKVGTLYGDATKGIAKLAMENQAREMVCTRLNNGDVPYETVLPVRFLESLRSKLDLYRIMGMDKNGQVYGFVGEPDLALKNVGFTMLAELSVYFLLGCLFKSLWFGMLWGPAAVFLLLASEEAQKRRYMLTAMIVSRMYFLMTPATSIFFVPTERKGRSQQLLREKLWGSGKTDQPYILMTDAERAKRHIKKVTVWLPEQPDDTKAAVSAWTDSGYEIYVLAEGPSMVIQDDEWRSYHDPILFTLVQQDGHWFAVIVSQYGDMPLRREEEFLRIAQAQVDLWVNHYSVAA